jgi:DNA-binding LacI/PurR family transcriptional regulator
MDQVGIDDANTIALDRAKGMGELVRHLTGLGHTQFGLLALSGSYRSIRDRVSGVETALAAKGLTLAEHTRSLDHLHVRTNDFDYGRLLATSFAAEKKIPTAMIALNDEIAIGAMRGLQEAGLKVPHDVSVGGFNNQEICLMPTPRLTSVDQQIGKTIELAADLLLSQIGQPPRKRPTVKMVDPLLVVRESTGPARR